MKKLLYSGILFFLIVLWSCTTPRPVTAADRAEIDPTATTNDTVRIANDELQYEIIIIDPGFNSWLIARAKPRGFYDQKYLEVRNLDWVTGWNTRVTGLKPGQENLFTMNIDYNSGTDYGYEVNYLLYNYLVYFQLKNNIRLGGFAPRP
ncbi:hypothetical protein E6C50_06940 [Flavobacterium supellecticarium]|uniref:Lipoprotein n=1 Tax=Flavobacterium supellecticarium TaxID=2565924 RepID=A0A4S3ZZQ9_9FLAO|nr:DUF6146 family protein [Flavobacterium supellecticarium]THF51493.1 hypothetical protein E6C50_06940 [Flavobacterium supellecticarium]